MEGIIPRNTNPMAENQEEVGTKIYGVPES